MRPVECFDPGCTSREAHSLRLSLDAHKQLKYPAVDLDVSIHDLLIEGVNEVFKKHCKKPIA